MPSAERMELEQTPTYGPFPMAGHEGFGDFVFLPVASRSSARWYFALLSHSVSRPICEGKAGALL